LQERSAVLGKGEKEGTMRRGKRKRKIKRERKNGYWCK
jgi:hypothetical protein